MSRRFYQIDAFADGAFGGNPAAVVLLEEEVEPAWMQAVAAEFNLSETAFVRPVGQAFGLRWFTPTTEVDLCGHATLAAACALWEDGRLASDRAAVFETRSGRLEAVRDGQAIALDFPVAPVGPTKVPEDLLESLGVAPRHTAAAGDDLLVELADAEQVAGAEPDLGRVGAWPFRGVCLTAQATDDADFVSRFFAPACGIDEDPVTGSAHCYLGPFWSKRLGKAELAGRQLSLRGGMVGVRCAGERVTLVGQAVVAMKGDLLV